jgi:hypothetical protein
MTQTTSAAAAPSTACRTGSGGRDLTDQFARTSEGIAKSIRMATSVSAMNTSGAASTPGPGRSKALQPSRSSTGSIPEATIAQARPSHPARSIR